MGVTQWVALGFVLALTSYRVGHAMHHASQQLDVILLRQEVLSPSERAAWEQIERLWTPSQ